MESNTWSEEMIREEAEKKVDEYGSSCWVSGSNDDCVNKKYRKEQDKLRQELIDALSSSTTPSSSNVSFEEFNTAIWNCCLSSDSDMDEVKIRALYDRMTNHSEDKLETVETQQKLTNSLDFETFKQALDICWDCGVGENEFSQGDEIQCDTEHCPAFKKLHMAIAKKSIESGEGFTFYIPERVDWKAIKPTGFLMVSISPREKCSKFKAIEVKS